MASDGSRPWVRVPAGAAGRRTCRAIALGVVLVTVGTWVLRTPAGAAGRGPDGRASRITEYSTHRIQPFRITTGPDGALWFTTTSFFIGRITTAGVVRMFEEPLSSEAVGITTGTDGALWFTEQLSGAIGRITVRGAYTEYPLPTPGANPWEIVTGADGALWFTEREADAIGRIDPATGAITEYPLPVPDQPQGIALGPDGNVWFTAINISLGDHVGLITPAGAITVYRAGSPQSDIEDITAGPDDAMWYADFNGHVLGRVAMDGSLTTFPFFRPRGGPQGIAAGPDGRLWFTADTSSIGGMTTAGASSAYRTPTRNSFPFGITAGPDGAMWFAETQGFAIGRIATGG